MKFRLEVNGERREVDVAPETPLLWVLRDDLGLSGSGEVNMRCRACHMRESFDPGGVPGAHQWVLAPRKMAWQGLDLRQLCEQVKDPERNGGRSLEEIVEHMSEDGLVGWGRHPGAGRSPAPGSQEEFGELTAAWVETGAACPE